MNLETWNLYGPMSNRSRHIYSASHDNRRQTECNEDCFNCRGAKEEKQSLKEPSSKESGTARGSVNSATGWIIKAIYAELVEITKRINI